jgi:hypothetical protein
MGGNHPVTVVSKCMIYLLCFGIRKQNINSVTFLCWTTGSRKFWINKYKLYTIQRAVFGVDAKILDIPRLLEAIHLQRIAFFNKY